MNVINSFWILRIFARWRFTTFSFRNRGFFLLWNWRLNFWINRFFSSHIFQIFRQNFLLYRRNWRLFRNFFFFFRRRRRRRGARVWWRFFSMIFLKRSSWSGIGIGVETWTWLLGNFCIFFGWFIGGFSSWLKFWYSSWLQFYENLLA